ncbi:MAG: hypothetical protein LBJ01_00460 [Tannerella sp.]|jgi:hypothetical protein|nr:hypothetical protein [Tannerella sp.]
MAAIRVTDAQAKRDWDIYYNNYIAAVVVDRNETEAERKKRVTRLEADFEEWKKYYFPKYCYAPAAPFHIKASRRILGNPEWYESRVWARELAKDAVCMMETLYQTLTGAKKNIILISNSFDKAVELIAPYKINLEKNERIIGDYGVQQMPGSWTSGDFVTARGVSFLAVGAGQSPRGSRNEEVRPDKVIISDIDTDEDVRNEEIIDKRWKWFEKAVFPTRSVSKAFQVVWLGNLIAQDCCVRRSMEKADKVDTVNLEDENGSSTWPEKNTREHIQRIKDKISTGAYQAEYMNNPLSEGKVFKEITWGRIPPLSKFRFLVNYGDPAPSNRTNQKNSLKAQYLLGFHDGRYYVITGFMDHMTNAQFVDCYYAIRDCIGGQAVIYNYIENNSLQDPFYEQVFLPLFEKASKEKGTVGIIPDERKKTDKYSRIEGRLEPLNRLGKLVFNESERGNPHMKALEEQFILFCPQMKDPAGPDAVEGAVWKIDEKIAVFAPEAFTFGKRRQHTKRF